MRQYTKYELLDALDKVGIKKGDILLVHSAIQNLGVFSNSNNFSQIPKILTEILIQKVGPKGTLLMPAFLYDFPQTKKCDLQTAKSTVGVMTEYFRQYREVERSCHPIFSHCGKGLLSNDILKPNEPEYHPFKEDSVMGKLHSRNAVILFLGIDIRVCTFMVYCEFGHKVEYRFEKPFYGTVTSNKGKHFKGNFYHFCFPKSKEIRENYSRAQKKLLDEGIIKSSQLGMGKIYSFRAAEFYEKIGEYLKADPWILLKHKPKQIYHFVDGVEKIKKVL